MSVQPTTITQVRLDNIIICVNAAVTTMEVISKRLSTPFLGPIVATTWSILSMAQVLIDSEGWQELPNSYQVVKKNKDVCVKMLEQIHQLLYAIIRVHMTSNSSGELAPEMLNNLGELAE
jgi:hypothetical protein